ncbi:MAG: dockerin type I repeat-containing protein, partial [Planctomycetes bacterium]|nr:dockerin type I repeat-containing protein [Planctomycetota bacterium]
VEMADGDLNDDGAIDAADYVMWRKGLGSISTPVPFADWRANFGQADSSGNSAGDFNHDGVIDAADYVAWRKGLATESTPIPYATWRANFTQAAASADFNRDGVIDAADYVMWRKTRQAAATRTDYSVWWSHFEFAPGGGAISNAAVPEPSTMLMFIVMIATMLTASRRNATPCPRLAATR